MSSTAATTATAANAVLAPSSLHDLVKTTPATAIARLLALKPAIESCSDPDTLTALAAAIPQQVADLTPEIGLTLVDIAKLLTFHQPPIPADTHLLTPQLQTAWLRVQINSGDLSAFSRLPADQVVRVVSGWSVEQAVDPVGVLSILAKSPDERVRMFSLTSLQTLVEQLAISGHVAFDHVLQLAADSNELIARAALRTLGKQWLVGATYQQSRKRMTVLEHAIDSSDIDIVSAALESISDLQNRKLLLQAMHLQHCAATAISLLGICAVQADITAVFEIAKADLLRYGASVRHFLLQAHRHGAFVKTENVRAAMEHFESHQSWTAEEFIRITHLVRAELLNELTQIPTDDPRWLQWSEVVALTTASGADALLTSVISDTNSLAIATAAIAAAGKCPGFVDDSCLFRWLRRLPEATLPVLRVKGTARGYGVLLTLVEDPFTTTAHRRLALPVLWALATDRAALMDHLAALLGPHDAGLLTLDLSEQSSARVFAAQRWISTPDRVVDADIQLEFFCKSGDPAVLPDVTRLFREVFRRHVADALQGDFSVKRQKLPELEQQIFKYGRMLIGNGRCVRHWIESGPETGRDLLLRFICEWLNENPSDAITVALLESAARHQPSGYALRLLEPYWRRGPVNVRRAAIEALTSGGDGARGLEFSLSLLIGESKEEKIQTQALAAVQKLGAKWAEPMVRAALESPNMAVKKAAADALSVMGNVQSVSSLVGWLGRHDNKGFRASLTIALTQCGGPLYCAAVINALEVNTAEDKDPRCEQLLHAALVDKLSCTAAVRLSRSSHPAHVAVVAACLEKKIALCDASADEFAARLHRLRRVVAKVKHDICRTLRVEGFSTDGARELVAQWLALGEHNEAIRTSIKLIVRLQLGNWISWLEQESFSAGLALVLTAAEYSDAEHIASLLLLVERDGVYVDADVIVAFIERAVNPTPSAITIRAIATIRALRASPAIGGLRRFRLLKRLGAVRTVVDLQQALNDCSVSNDVATQSKTLLHEVLAIPPMRDNEPIALTELRTSADNWFRHGDTTAPWLLTAIDQRPLDMPLLSALEPAVHTPKHLFSKELLSTLVTDLKDASPVVRKRSAEQLLRWSDAKGSWGHVLDGYLCGDIDLDHANRAVLAKTFSTWPFVDDPTAIDRLISLLMYATPQQLHAVVPGWLEQRKRGSFVADRFLHAINDDYLLPFLVAQAHAGEFSATQLIKPSNNSLNRAIVELAKKSGVDLSHLLVTKSAVTAEPNLADPTDPIGGATLLELIAIAADTKSKPGLAVRAVHSLTRYGAQSISPLEQLTQDRRPAVRSAALRALKTVASKEQTLVATAAVLTMETRDDVVVSLLKSLGHGRHDPTLVVLIERVTDRNPKVREAARAAICSWGGQRYLPCTRQYEKPALIDGSCLRLYWQRWSQHRESRGSQYVPTSAEVKMLQTH
jgi:HEAT repeat protein